MRGRWPAMVRLAYGLTGDAGHAEDIAQAAFATPTAGRPAPAHDPKVTDSPPTGTTRAAAGLATTGDVVAAGLIGMSDAIVSSASGKVAVNEEVEAGVVASDVTYLTVTFADGQQLKLIPVPPGGNRYVAWAAPEPMTVASVTAYLGGPYTASGQTETAIPFNGAGLGPSISLWLRPGQVAPPRGQALVGHGTGDGQRWSVTAYEGPWGTCFAISGGTGVCIPELRLATTETTDSTGGPGGAGEQLGSAAPGVGLLRYTLSNGKSLDVTPVTVGNERLFAFWLAKGVKPVSWTAYSVADGRQVGHGKA